MAYESGKYGTEAATYDDPRVEEKMSVGRYFATRIPTLKPPMNRAPNPFKLLGMLNRQQWLFFLIGFLGWTWDAFDFFTVSLVREHPSCWLPPFRPSTERVLKSPRRLLPFTYSSTVRFPISLGGERIQSSVIDPTLTVCAE